MAAQTDGPGTHDHPVGVGMVGCGTVLTTMFGPVFAHLERGRLVALCDTNASRLKAGAGAFPDAATYTNLDAMLEDPDVEAVVVGTPVYLHHDHVIAAAKAGKHVLCEKPMARSTVECEEMDRACHQGGVALMIGLMKRFDRSFRRAAEMVENGQLGRVIQIRFDWGWPDYQLAGWRDTRRTWGGLFQDRGSHTVDLACWWAGSVTGVSAELGVWLEGRQVEDQVAVTLEHASGAVSLHHLSRLTHLPQHEVVQIDGSRGSLVMSMSPQWSDLTHDPFQMTLYRHGEATDVTPEPFDGSTDDLHRSAKYLLELKHFCECIRQDTAPDVGAAQGRHVVEVTNAAYLSASTGRKVALPLDDAPKLDRIMRELADQRQKVKPVAPS